MCKMKNLKYHVFVLNFLFVTPAWAIGPTSLKQSESTPGYVPRAGFVPDSKTATAVAIAILTPIYGEAEVLEERPFVATLKVGSGR